MPPSNYPDLVRRGLLLPLAEYTHIIVSYSGGKDSLAAALLAMEEMPADKIEWWHQHVDGEPGTRGLMDWPCTPGYCRATAHALGFPLRFQWKHGGFEGEMLRDNARTAGVSYEAVDGSVRALAASTRGKLATRRLFPQVSADLSVRWCSAYCKIDVARRVIAADPRFRNANVLFLTGERRQESTARSKYREVEKHPRSNASRRVDQWRVVIDWTEQDVWAMIARHRIVAHPAYYLGWGRVSCMACIFGDKDQWASVQALDPARFGRIAAYETEFGKTIKKGESVAAQAARGKSFVADAPPELVALALADVYPADRVFTPKGRAWASPAGAYKRCGGPT